MEAIFDHLCAPGTHGLMAAAHAHNSAKLQACMQAKTVATMVVAAGKWAKNYPSFHRAAVALNAMGSTLPAPTLVVSNFAQAHLLHGIDSNQGSNHGSLAARYR